MRAAPGLRARAFWAAETIRRLVEGEEADNPADEPVLDRLGECLGSRFTHGIVHVGLSAVESGTAREAADTVLRELGESLGYFACPAFTPGFRRTGAFSAAETRPEVGGFSRICMEGLPPRTEDPIHSLFLFGEKALELLMDPVRDTFAPEGVFRRFVEPGSCWINIGVPRIVSTVFHYIERLAGVPYLRSAVHVGRIRHADGREEDVRQSSYRYSPRVAWNRGKIETLLQDAGALGRFRWRGALVRVVDGQRAAESLLGALRGDPYFLVTK